MKPISLEQFATSCGGVVVDADLTSKINGFSLDSREVKSGDLFLAIKGQNSDGAEFATIAIGKGAVATLAEREVPGPRIVVPNLVNALAQYGKSMRSKFDGPVIGITGSNGKTTTKELTSAALSSLGGVLKSPANRNTEYTSPLLWAEMQDQKIAVVEMAMRGMGQIKHLAQISQPTIGIVTTIGTAHIEKLGSREGIMRAKAELLESLPADGTAIVWREDDFWSDLCAKSNAPVMSFGFSQEADCRIIGYRANSWKSCAVRLQIDSKVVECTLPFVGRHQAQNVAAAILAAHIVGVTVDTAANDVAKVQSPPMRLEVIDFGGATILLDTYNASPDSTVAAIQALNELPCDGKKVVILGEMRELGDFAESGHRMVGKALIGSTVDEVMLTGGATKFIADEATMAGYPASQVTLQESLDLQELHEYLMKLEPGDVALMKGSRALGLERALQTEVTTSK